MLNLYLVDREASFNFHSIFQKLFQNSSSKDSALNQFSYSSEAQIVEDALKKKIENSDFSTNDVEEDSINSGDSCPSTNADDNAEKNDPYIEVQVSASVLLGKGG